MVKGHSGRWHHVRQADGRPISRWARILALLIGFVAAGWGLSALAQTAPKQAVDQAEPALQEIIVTGSRIAAPNEVSTSPIEVLSSKYIETSGKTDITDLIN